MWSFDLDNGVHDDLCITYIAFATNYAVGENGVWTDRMTNIYYAYEGISMLQVFPQLCIPTYSKNKKKS